MTAYDFDGSLELDVVRNSRRDYRESVFDVLDRSFEEMVQGYHDTPFGKIPREEEVRRLKVFLQIYEELEIVTQRVIDGSIQELEEARVRDLIHEQDYFDGGGVHGGH